MTEPSQLPTGTLIDQFRVSRMIGQGGMGEVYLARDTLLGRKVALKILLPRMFESESGVERFLFEARATARFAHPHIVTIYAAGQFGDRPYLALEYLEGETLRDRMSREPAGFDQTMRVGVAIADALREAHRHGILHRDLKPANVMIPADGRVRVLDFGLAKTISGDAQQEIQDRAGAPPECEPLSTTEAFRTLADELRGTPRYMAPEQWRRAPATPATDVWALGMILYELASGCHPWPGATTYQLCIRINSATPVPPLPESVHPELRALIERCVDKDPERRPQVESILRSLETLRPGGSPRPESTYGPFRGLLPCDGRDAGLFCGRDAEVDAFLERMRLEPVLPIVGPSGTGKSSLVQAGIIPRLQGQGRWIVLALRPGRQPMRALAARLLAGGSQGDTSSIVQGNTPCTVTMPSLSGESFSGPTPDEIESAAVALTRELQESPARLALKLAEIAEREQARVLLFVDQLEELVTLVDAPDIRRTFMESLCLAADDPEGPVRVVLTLRDDFLGRLAMGEASRQILSRVTVLRTPDREALEEILTRPVAAMGYRYDDPNLVQEMVAEVRGEAAALPLLQVAGQTLWKMRDRDGRLLLRSAYDAMGGVAGALAHHADGVLDVFSTRQLTLARQILVRLVSTEGTRAVVPRARMEDELGPEADEVLERLVKGRLVLIRRARAGRGEAELELVHESLVSTWALLGRWIEESHEQRVFLDEVRQAAQLWQQRGCRNQEVWEGPALAEARRKAERLAVVPALVRQFLDAGARRERRSARRRWILLAVLFVSLALVAGIMAFQRDLAVADRRSAEAAAELARAEQVRAELAMWEAKGAALQLRGQSGATLAAARSQAALSSDPARFRDRLTSLMASSPALVLAQHERTVFAAAVTPDGQRLVTGSFDKTARVWDLGTGEVLQVLEGHDDYIYAVDITPDGQRLVTGSLDRTARVWDLETGALLHVLDGHEARIWTLDVTPDGTRVVTGSRDGTARVWDLETGALVRVFEGHEGDISSLAITPDGRKLVTGMADNTVHVWDLGTGTLIRRLEGHQDGVCAAAVAPNGRHLLTGSYDHTARVWDLETGALIRTLEGHGGPVYSTAFTPDGERLVTGSEDKTARAWDLHTGRLLQVFAEHEDAVYATVVAPDGARLFTGSGDKTARVWDLGSSAVLTILAGHTDSVEAVAITPNGRRAATGSIDGTARVWDLETGAGLLTLEGHQGPVLAVDISPDGRRLVTGSLDRTARVWDLETGAPIRILEGHQGYVYAAAFAPDGARVATGSTDKTARVWDLGTGEVLHELSGHEGVVQAIAFAPDGQHLATGSFDRTVRVWDLGPGEPSRVLRGHDADVYDVAFAPDGQRLITGSRDKTARVWDLETGAVLHTIAGHADRIWAVAVTPDGERLVTGSQDRTARVWDLDTGALLQVLEGHEDILWAVAVSADGRRLVTGSQDRTARVWDIDPDRSPLRSIPELQHDAGAATNHRACRRTGQVIPILPLPDPESVWAPEERCAGDEGDWGS